MYRGERNKFVLILTQKHFIEINTLYVSFI